MREIIGGIKLNDVTPKKSLGKKVGMGCLILFGGFMALGVLGAILGDKNKGTATPVAASSGQAGQAEEAQADPEANLTGPQKNAARSARQYLDMSGFSRRGLIEQLSSSAGNGYERADATAAVDSLTVDWNEQAARSAKQYLEMSGFSCKGLIQQLSSDAGNKYTKSEATFGAKQAGAC